MKNIINFGKGGERMGLILFLLGLVFFIGGLASGALLPLLLGLVLMVIAAKVLAVLIVFFVIVLFFLRAIKTL
jgi:hypothetical protein